jgi:hypothetical protein
MSEPSGPASPGPGEPFLRGLFGAVALLLVARAAEPLFFGDGFYATLSIHPFWILVILAAVQGGFFVGVASAAAAAMLMDWPPRPAGVDITAHYVELAILPVQWLLAAIVIGAFRQGQIRSEARLAADNVRLRRMGDDLAAELQRMDDEIALLELHAATADVGGGAGPRSEIEGRGGPAAPGAALAALSALAMAAPDAFEAEFARAAAALGFAGAVFHVAMRVPVRAGDAPDFTAPDAERLRRQLSEVRVLEAGTAAGRQVAMRVGDAGFVATVTPCRCPAAPGADGDDRAGAAPPAAAAEAIARTAVLAAAVGFSGFRPAVYLTPIAGTDTGTGTGRGSRRRAAP